MPPLVCRDYQNFSFDEIVTTDEIKTTIKG